MKYNENIKVLILSALFILFSASFLQAQMENKYIRKGNKDYNTGNFTNAQVNYSSALKDNPVSFIANYNMGNTEFAQKKYDEAVKQYGTASEINADANSLALSNYNLGNTYMQQQKYKEAIESYIKSLKYNPNDLDVKYNLSEAQKKMQQDQQNKQNQNKQDNKDQNKDQNKENKQNQDQQNKDQQKDEKQNKQNQQNQNQQNQPQKQQISKQDAERLLNAIQEADKQVQQKLAKQKAKASNKKLEKDW
jgi:tetratricopeptide (TPR) repeat protein